MAIFNSRTGYKNGTSSGYAANSLFSVGTALYAVVVDTSAVKIRVHKSTNGGSTWTELDSTNAPTHSGATHSYDAAKPLSGASSHFIYVAYRTAINTVRIRRFNTTTDAWETSDIGTARTDIAADFPVRFSVRSDGDILLVYRRASDGWAFMERWEGSSWTATAVRFLANRILSTVMTTNSDRMHIFREDEGGGR